MYEHKHGNEAIIPTITFPNKQYLYFCFKILCLQCTYIYSPSVSKIVVYFALLKMCNSQNEMK